MLYFHALHYHCSTLFIVPTTHETIQYTQSKNKAQQIHLVSIEQMQPTTLQITTIDLQNRV